MWGHADSPGSSELKLPVSEGPVHNLYVGTGYLGGIGRLIPVHYLDVLVENVAVGDGLHISRVECYGVNSTSLVQRHYFYQTLMANISYNT